jgi:hypothetical protein
MDRNRTLAAGSVLGLVMLDVSALSIPAALAAVALVLGALVWFKGTRAAGAGIYVFVLAELSPVSLHISVPLAFLYQGLCIALLLALSVPLHHVNALSVHKKAALQSLPFAAAPFIVGALMVYVNASAYDVLQAVSVTLLVLLATLLVILVVPQRVQRSLDSRGL